MPFVDPLNPFVVIGLSGSFSNLQQNQANAHTKANPQGLMALLGSLLADSLASTDGDGGGTVGGSNSPNASDQNGRFCSGLNGSQSCMSAAQLSANLNGPLTNLMGDNCDDCVSGAAGVPAAPDSGTSPDASQGIGAIGSSIGGALSGALGGLLGGDALGGGAMPAS